MLGDALGNRDVLSKQVFCVNELEPIQVMMVVTTIAIHPNSIHSVDFRISMADGRRRFEAHDDNDVVNMQNSSDLETYEENEENGENSPCCFGVSLALHYPFCFGGLLSCAKKPLPSQTQWTRGLEDQ